MSPSSTNSHRRDNAGIGGFETLDGRGKCSKASGTAGNGKGANLKSDRDANASSSSSTTTTARVQHRGVRLRRRRIRGPVLSGGEGSVLGDCADVRELALSLGMSFAAIVAQVVKGRSINGETIIADHLSTICITAIKGAVENACGKRFECFLRSFEKSFDCTFKTLQITRQADAVEHRSPVNPPLVNNHFEIPYSQGESITQSFQGPEMHLSQRVETQASQVGPTSEEQTRGNQWAESLNHESNQLVLHGDVTQQLAHISRSRGSLGFNQSIMSTFERSVTEQARCNDLKEFEIGLTLKRLQMKQSQLDLSFYANVLEKVKLSMGFSKAHFKEEKLKNQMQDARHAEFLKRCIDFLVAGMLIMSVCVGYGVWVYSYQKITEATASCTPSPKPTTSWWVPKQMAYFNSGWSFLRCHVIALSRMIFGLLMIVGIAYSLVQRSAGPMMPVTFILLVLGIACGAAGKFCIDTLGGSGYWWLLYWEVLCLLHFFVNAFPSVVYPLLYGPVGFQDHKGGLVPFWLRRSVFFSMLLVLPLSSGFIPFASLGGWIRHFFDMALHTKET